MGLSAGGKSVKTSAGTPRTSTSDGFELVGLNSPNLDSEATKLRAPHGDTKSCQERRHGARGSAGIGSVVKGRLSLSLLPLALLSPKRRPRRVRAPRNRVHDAPPRARLTSPMRASLSLSLSLSLSPTKAHAQPRMRSFPCVSRPRETDLSRASPSETVRFGCFESPRTAGLCPAMQRCRLPEPNQS